MYPNDQSDNVLDSSDNRSDERSAVEDDSMVEVTENDVVPDQCVDTGLTRPRRERKLNVRYSPEVYDLSNITQRSGKYWAVHENQ